MSDDTRKKYFSDEGDSDLDTKAWEGAAIGGTVGATWHYVPIGDFDYRIVEYAQNHSP